MTRRLIVLDLAEDTTETECGGCAYATVHPWAEPPEWLCSRPEFARGGEEAARRRRRNRQDTR